MARYDQRGPAWGFNHIPLGGPCGGTRTLSRKRKFWLRRGIIDPHDCLVSTDLSPWGRVSRHSSPSGAVLARPLMSESTDFPVTHPFESHGGTVLSKTAWEPRVSDSVAHGSVSSP